MNNHLLRSAATLASLAAIGTLPPAIAASLVESAMTLSVAPSAIGSWLHDPQSATIRGFHHLMSDGRTAVILVGSYFHFGSHEARVSAPSLSLADDMITPAISTMQALNSQSQRCSTRK